VSTVEDIVAAMERRFGKANRVWVIDRGMVSAENIAWLNETGWRYAQIRSRDSSDLASEGRAHQGAHPGLLPRLRAVEDAAAMAVAHRARRFLAQHVH
jgi:hypothetical protein